jgi:hypothetical protein
MLVDVKNDGIVKKPSSITHKEAAGFGLVGLTTWVGLVSMGGLKIDEEAKQIQQKVLVIGASGGKRKSKIYFNSHLNINGYICFFLFFFKKKKK